MQRHGTLKTAFLAAAVLVVAFAMIYLFQRPHNKRVGHEVTATRTQEYEPSPTSANLSGQATEFESSRMSESPSLIEPGDSAVVPVADDHIDGVVVDLQNSPVPGVTVQLRSISNSATSSSSSTATSNGRGEFSVPRPSEQSLILPLSDSWAPLLVPSVTQAKGRAPLAVLVVAPAIHLEGEVSNQDGALLPGVTISVVAPNIRPQINLSLDTSQDYPSLAVTDARGHYSMERVPLVPRSIVFATAPEGFQYGDDKRELPYISNYAFNFVLHPSVPRTTLCGRVINSHGEGLPKAWVAIGTQSEITDGQGRFEFDLESLRSGHVLRAVKEGYLPVEVESFKPSAQETGAWPDPLLLIMSDPALSISATVVDSAGGPMGDIHVVTLDRTQFGMIRLPGEASSADVNREGMEDVEALLAGQPFHYESISAPDGRVRVGGLLKQPYRLLAFDPTTLACCVTEPVPAGSTGLTITIPASTTLPLVAGCVVDRRGKPVEGALVKPLRPLPRLPRYGVPSLSGVSAHTVADGRFTLESLPKEDDRLAVSIPPLTEVTELMLAGISDLSDVKICVPLPCYLKIDLTRSSMRASSLAVEDSRGESLPILSRQGQNVLGTGGVSRGGKKRSTLAITDGQSEVFLTSESARSIVLYDHGTESGRIPVDLKASDLNVIRP